MKLNRKGFTLVEVLAVIVILAVIMAIAIPNITSLIEKNKQDNYNTTIESIKNAAQTYLSDYRYEIKLQKEPCQNNYKNVLKINTTSLTSDSKMPIKELIDRGYLKAKKIKNTEGQNLDINNSFITIKYNCSIKDYDIDFENDLTWN